MITPHSLEWDIGKFFSERNLRIVKNVVRPLLILHVLLFRGESILERDLVYVRYMGRLH